MSHGDDYLLDPRARPDAEVEALERALMPLRLASGPAPERVLLAEPMGDIRPLDAGRARRRWFAVAACAAAAALWLWIALADGVLQPHAAPRKFVTADTSLTIPLGQLAEITLHAGSELDFVHWQPDELRLRLRRGRLTARVEPPPKVARGFFVVDTPLGRVVDQGCRYELSVKDDGSARVRVTEGAVTFTDGRREVFVPAGASAAMTGEGVGTPTFLEVSPDMRRLVRRYDEVRREADPQRLRDLARKLAAVCRAPSDTLPVWHLLREPDPVLHKIVTEALFEVAGAPDGAARLQRTYTADDWLGHLRVATWPAGG